MKKTIVALCALALVSGITVPAHAGKLVLKMLGASTHIGDLAAVDAAEQTGLNFAQLGVDPADFACFKMPLLNPSSDTQIGHGVDCLRFDDLSQEPTQIGLTAVSFFIMPGGVLVNMGATSLGAFLPGFGNGDIDIGGDVVPVTHATGSIPSVGAKSIVGGTGEFAGAKGVARVSGAVSVIPATPAFNCMWEVEFNVPPGLAISESAKSK